MESTSSVKSTGAIEGIVVDENSAVGDVSAVVKHDPVIVPIVSPVSPAPTKSAKEADSKAQAKRNSRNSKVKSRIGIPARPNPDRLSVHEPGVILRNVNHLRVSRFDHNVLSLLAYLFLVRTF
jgi:hypothetical protein